MSLPAFTTAPTTAEFIPPPPPPPSLNRTIVKTNHLIPNIKRDPNDKKFIAPLDTASWTSVIARHCKTGDLQKAVLEFSDMRLAGCEPNHVTFVTLLSGCASFPSKRAFSLGSSLHGYARKLGLDTNNVIVGTSVVGMYSKFSELGLARLSFDNMGFKNKVSWNTIIDGYVKNGKFEEAIKLFDEMPERDVVSWTALIGGFVRKGKFEEALECFQAMQLSGVEPDYVTIVSILSAVANLGTLGLGLWLHRYILIHNFHDNIRVNNSLIDMYCRCGCVEMAYQVFNSMSKRSLVSWNSIIVGLALNGNAEDALKYFDLMLKDRFEPDGFSFTGALTACSHAGLVTMGIKLFDMMKQVYGINPSIEHYGCMVDLYGRAGKLEEALSFIKEMPMKPNEVVLGSLQAACRSLGNLDLAERLMNCMYELDPGGDSNYVLLSNMYAARGSWHGASKLRKQMKELGIQKRPGVSSIEVDCVIHEFVAGDRSHVATEDIYAILQHLSLELKDFEHIPETHVGEPYEYE